MNCMASGTNAVIYAVMAALVISAFMNYVFYNQVQDLNHQLSTLQSKIENNTVTANSDSTPNPNKPTSCF